jgi:hypothetical protein
MSDSSRPPSLGVVASGIAHDVRGPVGVIIAVLHELEQSNGASGADLDRLLEMARRGTRKLERIATTLDAIAQLERPLLASVDLGPMINTAADRMRSLERRPAVKVTLPSTDGAPVRVQVAPSLFPHAIEEIVGWALRRNPSALRIEINRPGDVGPDTQDGDVRVRPGGAEGSEGRAPQAKHVVVVVDVVGVHALPASAVPFQDPLGLARQLLEAQGTGLSIEADETHVLLKLRVPAAPLVPR